MDPKKNKSDVSLLGGVFFSFEKIDKIHNFYLVLFFILFTIFSFFPQFFPKKTLRERFYCVFSPPQRTLSGTDEKCKCALLRNTTWKDLAGV